MAGPKITQFDNHTDVGDRVRLSWGPKRVTAIATPELLSDARTAAKYYAGTRPVPKVVNGKQVLDDAGQPVMSQVAGIDSNGKPIVLGEEMTYLEHGAYNQPPIIAFYVYSWQPRPAKDLEFNAQSRDACASAIADETDPARKASFEADLDGMLNYWRLEGQYDGRDEALGAAISLANEQPAPAQPQTAEGDQ